MKIIFVTLLSVPIFLSASAQDTSTEIDWPQHADEVFGLQDDDLNYEEQYENYLFHLSDPLDLNHASEDQLRLLNILTEQQIHQLIEYRNTQGNFLSVHELQAIPGFEINTIRKILPFVKISEGTPLNNKSLLHRIVHEKNNYLLMRYERTLERRKGFTIDESPDQRFLGSPTKVLMRFRASRQGDFSTGFTLEKDIGEPFRWKPRNHQLGFDHHSFHIQLQNKGKWKNILLGDFQVQAAQGLIMGSSFSLGKGAEPITTVVKSNAGVLPHTSSSETGFLRGIAATYQLTRHCTLTGFFSKLQQDATIASDSNGYTAASSFLLSGLHRNQKELERRKTIEEQVWSCIANVRTKKTTAGIIFHGNSFNFSVEKTALPYNQFSFQGSALYTSSVFFNYTLSNFLFFSEVAKNLNAGVAGIVGVAGSLHEKLDVSISYRNYQRHYYSRYANAFAESARPQNESGIYMGWKYNLSKKYQISGYTDLFYFPWLRYRSYSPSNGHEWLLRFNCRFSRTSSILLQVREESKVRNSSIDNNTYHTATALKRNYLIHAQYSGTKDIRFRTRIHLSTFKNDIKITNGLTLMQDIQWSIGRITLTARHALFDINDYDNRQFTYEDDVWLSFSAPLYYGSGVRNYLIMEFRMNENIKMWLRYSRIHYTDRDAIGTGADTIAGNEKNDVKFQLVVSL